MDRDDRDHDESSGTRQSTYYIDLSRVPAGATLEDLRRIHPDVHLPPGDRGSTGSGRRRGPSQNFIFPTKLYDILEKAEFSKIIAWDEHGRSWRVVDRQAFIDHIMKMYFSQTKFPSFIRQVNGWGFRRITKGKDQNSYYNEFFLRSRKDLVKFMTREPSTRKGHGTEPNLRKYRPLPLSAPLHGKENSMQHSDQPYASSYGQSGRTSQMNSTRPASREGQNRPQYGSSYPVQAHTIPTLTTLAHMQAHQSSATGYERGRHAYNDYWNQNSSNEMNNSLCDNGHHRQRNPASQYFAASHDSRHDFSQYPFPSHQRSCPHEYDGEQLCANHPSLSAGRHTANAPQEYAAVEMMGRRKEKIHNNDQQQGVALHNERIPLQNPYPSIAQNRGPQYWAHGNDGTSGGRAEQQHSWPPTATMQASTPQKKSQIKEGQKESTHPSSWASPVMLVSASHEHGTSDEKHTWESEHLWDPSQCEPVRGSYPASHTKEESFDQNLFDWC